MGAYLGPHFYLELLVKKLTLLLLLTILPLFADTTFTGCDASGELRFSLTGPGDEWQLAHHQTGEAGESIAEFIPADETLQDWTEMVTIMYLPIAPDIPGSRLVYSMVSDLKQMCRRADWCFIEKGKRDITYEWSVPRPSAQVETQHEIVRFVQLGDGWFRVAYTKKVAKLPEEERERWVAALLSAEQVKES